MAASLFSQPPIAYFQPLESPPNSCTPSFISCETPDCRAFGGSSFTDFETISSKVCGWAGELGKDHDLRQRADPCTWLFSDQAAPFPIGAELPSSALIPAAQRQPRVDFISSAVAMKNIFRAACDEESDVGVMVHRLGDWLVMDDGTEISEFLTDSTLVVEGDSSTNFLAGGLQPTPDAKATAETNTQLPSSAERAAEQRHRAAAARAEMAKVRASEGQQRLEKAWAALKQTEAEVQKTQELLHEALVEVSRTAEEHEALKRQRLAAATSAREAAPFTVRRPAPAVEADVDSCLQSLDLDPEEFQLYQNFLGHSVLHAINEDPPPYTPPSSPPMGPSGLSHGSGATSSSHTSSSPRQPPGLALDSPQAFRQVGVWKIADDASVVIGSQLLCLGNAEHPKLAVYLHHHSDLSDMVLLEHCIECLIAGVPEFAICLHRDGAVLSYSLYKLSELWSLLEERMAIGKKLWMTLEALRWIKRQCCLEGCTYWLSKSKSEPTLKLFKLTGSSSESNQTTRKHELPLVPVCPHLDKDLVVKNTFLQLAAPFDEVFRRSQSCPARIHGPSPLDDDAFIYDEGPQSPTSPTSPTKSETDSMPLSSRTLEPLRGRVSALFFRRAISSPPGANASRFFQCALDLEARCDSTDDESGYRNERQHNERMLLQSCCHLGLALCELSLPSADSCNHGVFSSEEALLCALRTDAPLHSTSKANGGRYCLVPLSNMRRHTPLLGICVAPWPSGMQGTGATNNHLIEPAGVAAIHRVSDALTLLHAAAPCPQGGLPYCNRANVEATAFPLVATTLLHVASDLLQHMPLLENGQQTARTRLIVLKLAWRMLTVARQFAALCAARQQLKLQPFFARIPHSGELLIRIEHLCGGLLLTAARQSLPQLDATDIVGLSSESWFVKLQRRLTKLELWLSFEPQKVTSALEALASQIGSSASLLDDAVGEDCASSILTAPLNDIALPHQQHWRLYAAWHYERSIRLLPKALHRGGGLLNQLMLVLSTALTEMSASWAEEISVEVCTHCSVPDSSAKAIEQLVKLDRHLDRAESLSHAAGHQAMAATVQASRGHLLSFAADILNTAAVSDVNLWDTTLDMANFGAVRELCKCHDDDSGKEDDEECGECDTETPDMSMTVGQMIGRLGHVAMEMVFSMQQNVDAIVNPEPAKALATMASGILQSGAARLWVLPPPCVPETECHRTAATLLTQALQLLPPAQSSDNGQCQPMAALLCAHAHHLHAEILLASSMERPQNRHQRTTWHIERARLALHSTASTGPAACVLLVRLHILQAKLLAQGSTNPRRQAEMALDEIVTGCRIIASMPRRNGDLSALCMPFQESRKLLLQQLQVVLRVLCTRENLKQEKPADAQNLSRFKELYRVSLQLTYAEVANIPTLYETIQKQEGR